MKKFCYYGTVEAAAAGSSANDDLSNQSCRVAVQNPFEGRVHTPAIVAQAKLGNADSVKLLLERGATVASTDGYGCTALHAAARGGHDIVVALLLEHLSPLNATAGVDALTPLHCATLGGELKCARLLLAAGADTTIENMQGKTALELAEFQGCSNLVALLRHPPPTQVQELLRAQQRLAFTHGLYELPICHDIVASVCKVVPPPFKAIAIAWARSIEIRLSSDAIPLE